MSYHYSTPIKRDQYACGWNETVYALSEGNPTTYIQEMRSVIRVSKANAAYLNGCTAALDAYGNGIPLEKLPRVPREELNT
jgi:hypothetical protein